MMMKFIYLFFVFLITNLNAQTNDSNNDDRVSLENLDTMPERMPRFPGCEHLSSNTEKKKCGDKNMLEFIYGELEYPKKAFKRNIEGVVVVSFTVENDGSLNDLKIVRDIGGGCGREVYRVMKKMKASKKWIPAIQDGKYVAVSFNLPITFKLENIK